MVGNIKLSITFFTQKSEVFFHACIQSDYICLVRHLPGAVGQSVVKKTKTIKKWFPSSSFSKSRIENRHRTIVIGSCI